MKTEKAKILIEAVEFFLENNKVEISYPNEFLKDVGKYKIIHLNGVKVPQKEIGSIIFIYCDRQNLFPKKWSGLTKDLKNQLLSNNLKEKQ
jgi:hypothetical protein